MVPTSKINGQAVVIPATKSPQALISEEVGNDVEQHKLRQLRSSLKHQRPHLHWRMEFNRSVQNRTVILFEPSVKAVLLVRRKHFQ